MLVLISTKVLNNHLQLHAHMKKTCSDLPSAPSVKGEKITTGVNQTSFFKKLIEQSIFIDKNFFFLLSLSEIISAGLQKI